ncbi:PQQ-binding-like beta-propeller repeat protein [Micromonospora sp. LOL_024]|uniref:outer membrane protein assembly factor BamB family protein n=1 Tax=Micromonospora sp. LOL_024 TaxID=3345412 RepID=UPI003A85FB7C
MGWATGWRRIVAVVAATGVAAAVAIVAYRVLAPAEVSTTARGDYPALHVPEPGVVGRLPVAPLFVDGRLRVYAAARQVYADSPVDSRYRGTPFWSYRRWPATLDSVVAGGTMVVSRWSDGLLVALDARTGRVAWRADGPRPDGKRAVRRTGTVTVWQPRGLTVSRIPDGRHVVVTSGDGELRAIGLTDGRQLWRVEVDSDCRDLVSAGTGGQLVTSDRCDGPTVIEFRDSATGVVGARWRPPGVGDELAASPIGCGSAGAGCAALRTVGPGDAATRGWLLGPGDPVPATALDDPDTELVGRMAVSLSDGVLVGRSVPDGAQRWRAAVGPGRVIAVQRDRVHVLTEEHQLVTLDPATGAQRSRFLLDIGSDGTGWAPGAAYAADGYVVVERLRRPVDPDGDDQRYYLTAEALIIAATG